MDGIELDPPQGEQYQRQLGGELVPMQRERESTDGRLLPPPVIRAQKSAPQRLVLAVASTSDENVIISF